MKEIFGPIVSMTITLAAVYAPIGFTQGPDRRAVPRVRLYARRRGDHIRHRRGDAVADDVVEAACGRMAQSARLCRRSSTAASPDSRTGTVAGLPGRSTSARDVRHRRRRTARDHRVPVHQDARRSSRRKRTRAHSSVSSTRRNMPPPTTRSISRLGSPVPPKRSRRSHDTFLIVGIDGGGSGFVGFKLKEWSERHKKAATTKQEIQNLLNDNAGVQAFVFAPPSLPGSATACRSSIVLRTIGDPAQAYEVAERVRKKARRVRSLHRRAELDVVRNAACAHRRRSRPGRRARRAGQRDRHDAWRARRRRADLEIRPRQPQLRRGQPGRAGAPPQSRTARRVLRPRRRTAPWCRSRRWFDDRDRGGARRAIEQFNQLNSATLSALPLPDRDDRARRCRRCAASPPR